jgi:hypothetical protein
VQSHLNFHVLGLSEAGSTLKVDKRLRSCF